MVALATGLLPQGTSRNMWAKTSQNVPRHPKARSPLQGDLAFGCLSWGGPNLRPGRAHVAARRRRRRRSAWCAYVTLRDLSEWGNPHMPTQSMVVGKVPSGSADWREGGYPMTRLPDARVPKG